MPKTALKKKIKWGKPRKLGLSQNKISLGLFALTSIVILVLIGRFITFVANLDLPFAPDSQASEKKEYLWKGDSLLNIIVKADSLYVLSFNPQEKAVTLLKIPDQLYLNVPFQFGNWPARSIYGIGQVESPPVGAKLLRDTATSSMGIPIDGYIIIHGSFASSPLEKTLENIRQSPLSLVSFSRVIKTDLSSKELYALYWGIKGARFDKIKVLDLEQSPITQSLLLPDGSRALGLDQLKLDQYIQGKLVDTNLAAEGLSIGIFNATDHPQLAQIAARTISNIGGRVVFTANSQNSLKKSVVVNVVDQPNGKLYSYKRLTQIFAPECILGEGCATIPCIKTQDKMKSCVLIDSKSLTSRADIIIFLGDDFFAKFNDRSSS